MAPLYAPSSYSLLKVRFRLYSKISVKLNLMGPKIMFNLGKNEGLLKKPLHNSPFIKNLFHRVLLKK